MTATGGGGRPHGVTTVDLPGRVVRFGPPGWLTVVHGAGVIALYPTDRVLEVSDLGEVSPPAHGLAGD